MGWSKYIDCIRIKSSKLGNNGNYHSHKLGKQMTYNKKFGRQMTYNTKMGRVKNDV